MQFLDRQGIINLSQEFSEKITLQFLISSKEVIRYMSLNPNDEEIILSILRTYPGIYEMHTAVNMPLIAKKSNHNEVEIQTLLRKLQKKEIIAYHSKNNDSNLIFNEVREDERTISRVSKYLENQNQLKKEQLQSVLNYIAEKKACKNKLILQYFGETTTFDCEICSFCISKKDNKKDGASLFEAIISLLKTEDLNSRDIQTRTKNNSEEVIVVLQNLLENNTIFIQPNNKYTLRL